MLKVHVLASGSRGNAAIVEDAESGLGVLVDCGICKRDFFARCDEAGFDVSRLAGILITHDHGDHTKGLPVVARGLAKLGLSPTVYALPRVVDASANVRDAAESLPLSVMSLGDCVSVAGMQAHVLRTSHDAAASCAFRFEGADGDALGYLTDSGIVTPEAHEGLSGVRILALESNHDLRMLEEGPYPFVVKRRIASDVGHLSNDQAAAELASLLSARLEAVVAMHVSETNNDYEAPVASLSSIVAREGHPARVLTAYQGRSVSVG